MSYLPVDTTTLNTVTATATPTKMVHESTTRLEAIISNTSPTPLYLAFSMMPSTTTYAVAVQPGGTFFTNSLDAIYGVWASAAGGQANISERY